MLISTPLSLEQVKDRLNEVRKLIVGYFRFHDKDNIELVVGYTEATKQVHVFHLAETLAVRSHSIPSSQGVLVMFGHDENLYTLKTTNPKKLDKFLEKVRKPEHRPSRLSAYVVPGL